MTAQDRDDLAFRRVNRPDVNWYRELYNRVGREWLWTSRLAMSDARLRDHLGDPLTEIYVLSCNGHDEGIAELDRRAGPDVEVVYFGITSAMFGQGAGRWLMERTLALAWSYGTTRVWLHTCTLDHPGALAFYQRLGFKPYRRCVEITADPRLNGQIPIGAAAHYPLLS